MRTSIVITNIMNTGFLRLRLTVVPSYHKKFQKQIEKSQQSLTKFQKNKFTSFFFCSTTVLGLKKFVTNLILLRLSSVVMFDILILLVLNIIHL